MNSIVNSFTELTQTHGSYCSTLGTEVDLLFWLMRRCWFERHNRNRLVEVRRKLHHVGYSILTSDSFHSLERFAQLGMCSQHHPYRRSVKFCADDIDCGFASSSLASTLYPCFLFVDNCLVGGFRRGNGRRPKVRRSYAGAGKRNASRLTLGVPTEAGPVCV